MTWEEFFNINASGKIYNVNEVKFPFNFRGMKDFVPIVRYLVLDGCDV